MKPQIILDQIIFQLTPTRTRCELFAVAGDVTEKLSSGLLKPFLSHLQTAEEQLAKGGYSIKLQPPLHSKASWFTKGTAERFVRFVSSPEVIERVNTIETELMQLEETISMQTLTLARVEDELVDDSSLISILGEKTFSSSEKARVLKKMRQDSMDSNDSGASRNSKKQLLRALDARRMVLQKEQGMAFARAAAAGFELLHLLQLIVFSDCFGAARLREACVNFVALCRKRQIAGFCVGDRECLDQDLTWALSNTTCVSILNSMKEVSPFERKREVDSDVLVRALEPGLHDDRKPHSGCECFELSSEEKGYQPKLLSARPKLSSSSPVCEWSNSTDLYQGWPAMYTTRNYPYATFQSYQYGFSPGSQESFTTFPGMSPTDATGLYQHPMGVLGQPLSETPENLQMSSSQEMQSFPSLRKLQVRHRNGQTRCRMSDKDFKGEESVGHGYEKDSSDLTDTSFERQDSLRSACLVRQEGFAPYVESRDDSRQGPVDAANSCWNERSTRELPDLRSEGSRGGSDSSDLSSGDASIVVRQSKERARLDRHIDGVQGSEKTVFSDNFSADFEQCREGSLGSKLKKRLDFQEPEAQRKQQPSQQELRALDDSFYVHPHSGNYEQRSTPMIECVVQGNQIFDRMSKQALKANSKQALKVKSVMPKQDPDDLLMMPKQRKRAPTRNFSDVMSIDIELLKSTDHANLRNSQKGLINTEPSQERVKKFLDQYNEKREAKMRGELNSSKRAEREGKLKAMREDLESRKSEMARARRPEKAASQTEAQLRADKLRLYKADLQKVKKEKEDEARRRLEKLKAQRQERIAARSHSAACGNPNLSTPQGRLSSKLPASTSKPGPIGRLSSLQKSRASFPNSQTASSSRQRTVHSQEFSSKQTPPSSSRSFSKPAVNQVRSSASSAPRQTKAGIGSQPLTKTQVPFKAPQGTKSGTSARSSSVSSALFEGREIQRSRTSFLRKSEPLPITSKDPGSRSSLPGFRGQTIKAGKEMKQDGKTFLKKGSGIGSSGRSVQRSKTVSPVKARALGKGPLFCASSPLNGVKMSRLDMKEAKVPEGTDGVRASRSVVKKTSTSIPQGVRRVNYVARAETKGMNLSKSKPKETGEPQSSADLVQSDFNHSRARYSHDEDMVRPSSSSHQPKSSIVLQKNHTPSEAAMNSHQRLPADSTMSLGMLCDRSCTINGDPSSNKQSIIFNTIFPIKNSYPESTISSGTVSWPHFKESTLYSSSTLQTPCKQQSTGFEKATSGDEFSTRRGAFHERSEHRSQSAMNSSKATVDAPRNRC